MLLHHVLRKNYGGDYGSHQIQIDHLAEVIHLQIKNGVVRADGGTRHIPPGTVDQHINLSVGSHDITGILLQHSLVGDIRLQEDRLATGGFHALNQLVPLFLVPCQHRHLRTMSRQVGHHRAAQHAGTSRDDNNLILYIE